MIYRVRPMTPDDIPTFGRAQRRIWNKDSWIPDDVAHEFHRRHADWCFALEDAQGPVGYAITRPSTVEQVHEQAHLPYLDYLLLPTPENTDTLNGDVILKVRPEARGVSKDGMQYALQLVRQRQLSQMAILAVMPDYHKSSGLSPEAYITGGHYPLYNSWKKWLKGWGGCIEFCGTLFYVDHYLAKVIFHPPQCYDAML